MLTLLARLLRRLCRLCRPSSPADRPLTRREIRRIDRAVDWPAYERELTP